MKFKLQYFLTLLVLSPISYGAAATIKWNIITPETEPRSWNSIAPLNSVNYKSGRWLAVGERGQILSSNDGLTWTPAESPFSANLKRLKVMGDYWVVLAGSSLWRSVDGLSWTAIGPAQEGFQDFDYRSWRWSLKVESGPRLMEILGKCMFHKPYH
jgi:photosystem II stability/assembly factor-like uncharacterized protein